MFLLNILINNIDSIVFALISLISLFFSLRLVIMFITKNFSNLREKRSNKKISSSIEDKGDYPFFSILIPARNEAEVIEKTLSHIIKLNYPNDKFEIIVIVDAKENFENKTTTKDIVFKFIGENCNNIIPAVKCLEVPVDFDGKLNGVKTGRITPSTKGRALNYGLTFIECRGETHYCSFFDAESHPDVNILLELRNNINKDSKNIVYQGPLFQVRNFWKLSYFSKVVALSQAFSHEYGLPFILKFIPFLGGTNMHIPLKLIRNIGGFASSNITEDLDLGVRCELDGGIKPSFINVPSSEQTPPSIKGYIMQRFRWGKGAFEVISNLNRRINNTKNNNCQIKNIKKLMLKLSIYGPVEWIAYFIVAIYITINYIERLTLSMYTLSKLITFPPIYAYNIIFTAFGYILTFSAIMCGVFVILLYFKYSSFITDALSSKNLFKLSLLFLYVIFALPFVVWIFSVPFIGSFVSSLFGVHNVEWVKTERTAET